VTAGGKADVAAPTTKTSRGGDVLGAIVGLLGSMKLAVWLVLILLLLTWLGTLAQVDRSTYDVQREYFESWFVVAELPLSLWGNPLFADADGRAFPLKIPLPGAYPVMALLFANLVVGGMVRLRWSMRNAGVLTIHLGIAFLLVAGFVKLHYSWAGSLALYEQPTAGDRDPLRAYELSRFVSFHDFELAVLEHRGDQIVERVVPESELWGARGSGSVTIRGAGLPFTLQVHHWLDDCRTLPKEQAVQAVLPVIEGVFLSPVKVRQGEQPKSEMERAGCYVTIFPDGGDRIETMLWGFPRYPDDQNRYPFVFQVAGVRYGLDLRHVVHDLPFALRLDRFQKVDHPGTLTPKDFRSYVSVVDGGQVSEAQIFMNNPLRKDDFVVYQTSWGPQVNGVPRGGPPWFSVFEVSYNPSDVWPALACGVIALGLLWHFLAKLSRFLRSSARTSLQS
jgi:hypothetical protein